MADGALPPSVRAEALRLLGVSGEPEAALSDELELCYAEMRRHSSPRAVYKIFGIRAADEAVEITPELRLCGAELAKLCKDCRRAALLAATLGAGVDRLIARAQAESISRAMILDACASAEIERLCDESEPAIMAEAARGNLADDALQPRLRRRGTRRIRKDNRGAQRAEGHRPLAHPFRDARADKISDGRDRHRRQAAEKIQELRGLRRRRRLPVQTERSLLR